MISCAAADTLRADVSSSSRNQRSALMMFPFAENRESSCKHQHSHQGGVSPPHSQPGLEEVGFPARFITTISQKASRTTAEGPRSPHSSHSPQPKRACRRHEEEGRKERRSREVPSEAEEQWRRWRITAPPTACPSSNNYCRKPPPTPQNNLTIQLLLSGYLGESEQL